MFERINFGDKKRGKLLKYGISYKTPVDRAIMSAYSTLIFEKDRFILSLESIKMSITN